MQVRFSDLEVSYSSRGNPTYRLELWHDGLKKHRLIKGSEPEVIRRKAELQAEDWTTAWAAAQERDGVRKARADEKQYREDQKALAMAKTNEAQAELRRIDTTLQHTLAIDDTIDWERLKDTSTFPEPRPKKPNPPPVPDPPAVTPEPSLKAPQFGLLDHIFAARKTAKVAQAAESFRVSHFKWTQETEAIQLLHRNALQSHAKQLEKLEHKFERAIQDWEARRDEFLEAQQSANAAVDRQRERYDAREPEAIEEYCDIVLSTSDYPDWMPKEFELNYIAENATLLIGYALPAVQALPIVREVAYTQSRDEFTEKTLSDVQIRQIYDSLVYQITLRTVHEILEADQLEAIASVVFNGYVTSVDRSTGLETTACILSLQVKRAEFMSINLAQVDPKACFKALKGVGSSKLHSLTPVAPIMELRREDGRFVAAHEVAITLDDSVNLAAMDWEDFEHLIRELFEQEFRSSGGEVKVTQASRDGGVDAVAFDPDPIRGGKIVIQAKRYTNTVGVAAVRDLYGTVLNEGATKGILVTTSDYGPDAYGFAKDKPLVLLNGANLLHLLEKHGHRARINIKEAREQSR